MSEKKGSNIFIKVPKNDRAALAASAARTFAKKVWAALHNNEYPQIWGS